MQAVESLNSAYEVKNLLLTRPSDWFIQDQTFERIKDSTAKHVKEYSDHKQDVKKWKYKVRSCLMDIRK